jgi:DNA gyrase inhibitor GyrI
MLLPDGKYAVFKHVGSLLDLHVMYRGIYENWLPQSGYYANGTISFERYLVSPVEENINEITTEIYIPIKKLK